MATVTKWNPFGVSLNITATAVTVTRTSATKYTVKINASWESYWGGAKTDYGMKASSGGNSVTLNTSGNKSSGSSGSFTGEYAISGNGSATKTITVTFENFNTDHKDSATKSVSFNVTVPAWTSYSVKYNANGGTGAPSAQTKWKDQTLVLSTTKPTRTGYSFLGWSTSSTATSATYASGGNYTSNAAATLYAVWKANTYAVKYDANGGSGAPSGQTKTYGVDLTLSSTIPSRKNYNFLGWSTSKTAITPTYKAGAKYTTNSAVTLYAVWELAYVKPKVSNLTAIRCDSKGNRSTEGTYVKINATIVTFEMVRPSCRLLRKLSSVSGYSNEINVNATLNDAGNAYTISVITGDGSLDVDSAYDFCLLVTDSETTYAYVSVPGSAFAVDYLVGGKGVAFGKKAERYEAVEFAWPIYANAGFHYPIIPDGKDLRDMTTPGVYYGDAASSHGYLNCPITSATSFTLEVFPAGSEGQLMQRITACSATNPSVYHCHYYKNTWYDWVKTY